MMLFKHALAVCCLGSPFIDSEDVIDAIAAGRAFDSAQAISDGDAGSLWGHTLYGPMLFLDATTKTMAANRSGPGLEEVIPGVFVGPISADLGFANTAQRWSDQLWTTVVLPLPEGRFGRGRLLAHEMFHRIQPSIGACEFPARPNVHLDGTDGRTLLRLELRALADALVHSGASRRRAVNDALLFRARRHALYPGSNHAEVALESNEGVAEYTGWVLGGLPIDDLESHVALALIDAEGQEAFGRSFAYATGPAYGLLLDAVSRVGACESWREGFDGTIDFGAATARAYGLHIPGGEVAVALDRLGPYDGETVVAHEKERAERRRARIAELRGRLVDGPVLVVPASGGVRYTFDPYRVEALDDLGQVYGTLTVKDEWGELRVTSGGALMRRGATGAVNSFQVPAPGEPLEPGEQGGVGGDEEAVFKGPGWELRLAEGWRLVGGERAGDLTLREGGGD